MASNTKITADDIRRALYARYREPEWLLGFEVGNSTGGQCRRHADAVAINTYPSRGYDVKGFEIKVSRSDLKHELDNAAKAEAVAQYCNEWYLVVPKGLTENMDVPHNWGIIELVGEKLVQKREATYMQNKLDYGFMCAFIRGMQRCTSTIKYESEAAIMERLSLQAKNRVKYQLEELERYKKQEERFKKATNQHFLYMSDREFKIFNLYHNLYDYRTRPEHFESLARMFTETMEIYKKIIAEMQELLGAKEVEK